MIQFNEVKTENGIRVFLVAEDGLELGMGTLTQKGRRVEIAVAAAKNDSAQDLLLRGLVNVLSGMPGVAGVLSKETVDILGGAAYLMQFGFTKAPGSEYTVEAGEIRLEGKCKK
ncbi:MAG: hypothetical protein FWD58_00465 [Firmicutes bacterium]|nr:hypothetical protein [Bacillota bacterium]